MRAPFQRPGSPRWHWEFRRNGHRYCGHADTKAKAQTAMDAKRAEIFTDETYETIHGHKPFKPTRLTVEGALDYFFDHFCAKKKSAARDSTIIRHLKARWSGRLLSEITTGDILAFKKEREDLKRSAATIGQEVGLLRRFFKQMVLLEKLAKNPAAPVKKPRVKNDRVKFLEPEQATALMTASPPWLRDLITFARFTGCREGEILALTWTDVDLKRGLLTLGETKNGDIGHVEINATTRALLERLPRQINGRVFPKVTPYQFRIAWETAVLSAGLTKVCKRCEGAGKATNGSKKLRCRLCKGKGVKPDFRFHDLRHDAATALVTAGATLYEVQIFLRQKSEAMARRYGHMVRERRARTAALLDHPAPKAEGEPKATGEGSPSKP